MLIVPKYYIIQSVHSGKVFDVRNQSCDDNGEIIQFDPNNQNNQKFLFIPCGENIFYIQGKESGKFLTIDNEYSLKQYHLDGINDQKFVLEQNSSGKYLLKSLGSQLYLTIQYDSSASLAPIVQTIFNNQDDQQYNLIDAGY